MKSHMQRFWLVRQDPGLLSQQIQEITWDYDTLVDTSFNSISYLISEFFHASSMMEGGGGGGSNRPASFLVAKQAVEFPQVLG